MVQVFSAFTDPVVVTTHGVLVSAFSSTATATTGKAYASTQQGFVLHDTLRAPKDFTALLNDTPGPDDHVIRPGVLERQLFDVETLTDSVFTTFVPGVVATTKWKINLYENATSNPDPVALNVPWQAAAFTWTLDGPGSVELDLTEKMMQAAWRSGLRRIIVEDQGERMFQGWVSHVSRSGGGAGTPGVPSYKAAALGLGSILDYRVVHGGFRINQTVSTTAAWRLIDHAQKQTEGDMGFTQGAVSGTAPARSIEYCDGDVIGQGIRDLAAAKLGGFDWEIDSAGRFNSWVGGRGSELSPVGLPNGILTDVTTEDWEVTSETADIATYVTAMGETDQPCGPPLVVRSKDSAVWGRREVVVDVDSNRTDELQDAADAELDARLGARLSLSVTWVEQKMPWAFGAVWLGDVLTVSLEDWFGGEQQMRVQEIEAAFEPGTLVWCTYKLVAA